MPKKVMQSMKKTISVLLVVLMAAGWLLQPAYAQGTSGQAVTANVNGSLIQGSKAIANTVFSVHNKTTDHWFDTKSDVNGQFTFTLTDGNYELFGVWVDIESKWYPLNQLFTVSSGALVGASTLQVTLPANNAIQNVTGKLTNDGTPVANITFSVHSTGEKQNWYDATTDANGQFSFSNVPDGEYQLEGIWLPSENKWYAFDKKTFNVDLTATVNIDLTHAINLDAGNFTVIGTLFKNNSTLSNVIFSIHTKDENQQWYDVKTDENGQFALKLPAGDYQLDGVWLDSDSNWYVLNQALTVNEDMSWDVAITVNEISGSITKDGQMIANTIFSFHAVGENPKWFDSKTDEKGKFILLNIPDGDYQIDGIWVEAEEKWYPLEQKFSVINHVLAGTSMLMLDLQPPASEYNVRGFIKDDNGPVGNARIRFGDSNFNLYFSNTNVDGAFIVNLPDGDYTVKDITVSKDNSNTSSLNLKFSVQNGKMFVNNAQVSELTIKIPTLTLRAAVVETKGSALPNVIVTMRDTKYAYYDGFSNEKGELNLRLPDGLYNIVTAYVIGSKSALLNQRFEIKNGSLLTDGTNTELLKVTIPDINLNSKLVNNGDAISGVDIMVRNKDTLHGVGNRTDVNGDFSLRLVDGTYTFDVDSYGLSIPFSVTNGVVSVDLSTIDVVKFDKNVTGVVQDGNGVVANAQISIEDSNKSRKYISTSTNGSIGIYLPDGEYTVQDVTVSKDNSSAGVNLKFSVKEGKLFVNNAQVPTLDIKIPNITVRGTVVDSKGALLKYAGFTVKGSYFSFYNVNSNDKGEFNLRLPDGVYNIVTANLKMNDLALVNMPFEIRNGSLFIEGATKASIKVTIPDINLIGKLVNNGEPMSYTRLIIMNEDTRHGYGIQTDANGYFSMRLADGAYTFWVADYGVTIPFNVTNGVTSIDLSIIDLAKFQSNATKPVQDASERLWTETTYYIQNGKSIELLNN